LGAAYARAKLKIPVEGGRISNGQRLMRLSDGQRVSLDGQLVDVEMETALARTRVGKISAGYVQELRGGGQKGEQAIWRQRAERETRVGPGRRALDAPRSPRDGERADKEVREDDDGVGGARVAVDGPGRAARQPLGVAKAGLEATDDEQVDAHGDGAEEEHGPAAPAVDVDDGRLRRVGVSAVRPRSQQTQLRARSVRRLTIVATTLRTYWTKVEMSSPRRPVMPADWKTW